MYIKTLTQETIQGYKRKQTEYSALEESGEKQKIVSAHPADTTCAVQTFNFRQTEKEPAPTKKPAQLHSCAGYYYQF